MATRLKSLKSPGDCCPCAQQANACECSAGNCGLQCRYKGGDGTAELCGFPEYSPSTPPKKFRRISASGTTTAIGYSGPSCEAEVSTLTNAVSGEISLDKDTCEETDTTNLLTTVDGVVTFDGPFGPVVGPSCPASDDRFIWTCDDTSASVEGTGNCVPLAPDGSQICSGSNNYSLSDEDTDDDAIGRATSAIAEWITAPDCPNTPAFITLRTSGFSFGFRRVQSRVHLTALTDHHSYKVTTRFFRRVLGSSGPWIFFSLVFSTVTPISEGGDDPNSMFTGWEDIPNEAGFETRAQNCEIEDVTL